MSDIMEAMLARLCPAVRERVRVALERRRREYQQRTEKKR